MPIIKHKQGEVIYGEGELLKNFSFITNGVAEIVVYGRPFRFEKGDMPGILDLYTGAFGHTYTAVTDVTLYSYLNDKSGALDALLAENADAAYLMVNSMGKQTAAAMQFKEVLRREAAVAYGELHGLYTEYERLCALYAAASRKLLGLSGITPFSGTDPVEDWVRNFYLEISGLEPAATNSFFHGKPGISAGFLRRAADDAERAFRACGLYREYLAGLSRMFLNADGQDLFALIAELHFSSLGIGGADAEIETLMLRLAGDLSGMTSVDAAYFHERLNAYKTGLTVKRASLAPSGAAGAGAGFGGAAGPAFTGAGGNPADQLNIILDYSECPDEVRNKFIRLKQDYAALPDRGGTDDESRRLRNDLTGLFYDVYQRVFLKSLKDPALSTIIKMFLDFGYVDAQLAGIENADYLYAIADALKGDPEMGAYTLREWLTAIYEGRKEPNRNEFDMDYVDTIREMKAKRQIDAKEETRLAGDMENKLKFELTNVFPSVNKITFGRITTFCPLFSEQNVTRKLSATLVTPALIKEALDEIRGVDFSAYYRETVYSNSEYGIPNEFIHTEVLPDIILMPNVGIRGVMWQEIEGKKRATPSRMFLPVFLEGDLKNLLVRLTGEFRWEMCRRIQGARWNDLSEPSLTSEYVDYLQFYRKNSELTVEMKEAVKLELERAKKNYRAVFVSNYADWLQYEAKGSLRLNRQARKMLFKYCTFSAPIREKLRQNPQYAELFAKFNVKQQKNLRHMASVVQKVKQSGRPVPRELESELTFLQI